MKLSKMNKNQLIEMLELQLLKIAGDNWRENKEQETASYTVIYQGTQFFFHTIMSDSHEIVLTETPHVQTQEEWNKSFDIRTNNPQYESVLIQLIQASK